MLQILDVIEWPATRDVARRLDVSHVYVNRLIHSGQVRAVRTRLGWLLDPESVAAYEAQREKRRRRSSTHG